MLEWTTFPLTKPPPSAVADTMKVFEARHAEISSLVPSTTVLTSNEVLAIIRPDLVSLGFDVEGPKHRVELPVLYGERGSWRRKQNADAWNHETGVVVEIEAGGARQDNRALLDILKGCVWIHCQHLVVAVKREYHAARGANDYAWLLDWVELLYASDRLELPMDSLTVVGY